MQSSYLAHLNTALAGRYAIERELGSGGMATVYLADDVKHHRKVAVKVLRPELASALGPDRFLREIAIAAHLNHPHILALYDSGDADGLLYYVMPYVRDGSLRQKLTREKQLPIEDAVRIARHVASALEHAHSQNLIHRDIKPENILLYEGEAMVADFGIALAVSAAAGERLTEIGVSLGTPEYMSPEQAMGERGIDSRSDVYSLGCVLYEMLAGEPPYTGPNHLAVLAKRLTDPVPAVRRLRDAVPPGVERALMKALASVPADRFASAAEFGDALSKPAVVESGARAVAVLPFLNLSADPDNEYFADGITEDVIIQLSKIRALKVISRTSIMPFKNRDLSLREIGAKLQAGTLLEGSVRRAGDRVRIVAQLIDAETDQHLWAETYDRQLTDIFAIQTDVALHIATALKAGLSPDETTRIRTEPTDDVQAYQLYLLGKHCLNGWTREGGGARGGALEEIDQGIRYFEQAVARDPNYALAHAAMANAYTELGLGPGSGALRSEDAFRRARIAVTRALELDGSLAEAHSMLGFLRFACDFDWAGAEEEFKRALELNPNSGATCDAYGLMLMALERYDEALEMQRRAHELEPLAYRLDIATTFLRAGRNDEALRIAAHAIELDPHFVKGRATLGWAYLQNGMPEQGLAELESAVSLAPDSTLFLAQLGEALALMGKTSEARKVLQQLEELSRQRYVSPYHFAYVYTGLGEKDTAIDWLERAYEERAGGVYGIKGSFLFATLRSHPRFTALLRKMNLA
jgi:serine/threonine-protein kinase